MSGQGSGHKGGQQNHQSQKPLRLLRPSNQAGVPAHAAASTATEPLEDLQGINHEFFKTNGSKDQGLAREHPRWPDILVVDLLVLRKLLGLELIDFPDLIRSHDEFRNVQLRKRQMNSSKLPLGYHFLTKKDAMILALAVSRDPISTGPCNECGGDAHEPSVPLLLECRSVPNINGRACGNCELHNHRRECSFCELCFPTPSHADY